MGVKFGEDGANASNAWRSDRFTVHFAAVPDRQTCLKTRGQTEMRRGAVAADRNPSSRKSPVPELIVD